jgi:hypothetical protein
MNSGTKVIERLYGEGLKVDREWSVRTPNAIYLQGERTIVLHSGKANEANQRIINKNAIRLDRSKI